MATQVPGYRPKVVAAALNVRVVLQELGKGCVSKAITELGRPSAALPVCQGCRTCVTHARERPGRQLAAKQVRRAAGEAVTMHFFLVHDFGWLHHSLVVGTKDLHPNYKKQNKLKMM